ncbi:S1 RNA-binding domain-containing protein [Candidatus Thiothrix sp. Deng01]|uniref:S1 RNA-binding domain-containing protein n=1 Tax=Candidatus Thiothrix phosphatis TaxID=3112415 RepID=A0ABU6CZ63_9GAMM|nr:S1 RNA-binding domain-containing protein [Candidatus Thiothrix sp. Deng01]MEB4592121.1 S1 RNA-binding domain-containing protein [Candidatus Thiothrix sp. Deng01]
MKDIKKGSLIDVIIENIEERGLYISYCGIKGFIDVLRLSWTGYRDEAKRFYRIGELIKVKVLEIKSCQFYDFQASLRDVTPERNPWLYKELFASGSKNEAVVRKVLDHGYFIYLGFGLNAYCPINKAPKILCEGDIVVIKIITVEETFPNKIIVECL